METKQNWNINHDELNRRVSTKTRRLKLTEATFLLRKDDFVTK
jgi:hypothetical protein